MAFVEKLKRMIRRILHRENPDAMAMKYCIDHGFVHGKNFSYNNGFPIDSNWPWLISVGDNVTLATGVKLLAHDASTARIDGVHTKIGIVEIGNNVFIGANTVVLPNVRIGNNVIVGAASVVSHNIPDNSVYAGNPAKKICTFEEYSAKHIGNQSDHPIFREHSWNEWRDQSEEERSRMKDLLKDTFGYL